MPGWGGQKAWGTICGRIFAALTDTEGVVVSSRRGLQAHISRRGRPGLRLTVWRAVWPMLRFNGTKARRPRHSQGSGQGGIWVPVKKANRRIVINERVISEPLHGTALGTGIPVGVPHWQQVRTPLV